jgi:hypothetical protein
MEVATDGVREANRSRASGSPSPGEGRKPERPGQTKKSRQDGENSMFSMVQDAVPEDALLKTYRGGLRPECWGRYGDCFAVTVPRITTLAEFVFAFYTSLEFRIERLILRILADAPSTDAEARMLADGFGTSFAIWRVAERTTTQLLMCDRYERTRSWFCVVPLDGGKTLLRFGSAVAASGDQQTGARTRDNRFRLLLKFHVVYSQVLLNAARRGVMRLTVSG